MAYETGFMNKRVQVLARGETTNGGFGRNGGTFIVIASIWANVTFVKGVNALREGAYDAYDTKMVRCRWHDYLTRECRLRIDGTDYKIDSFNADRKANIMQIVVTELQNK